MRVMPPLCFAQQIQATSIQGLKSQLTPDCPHPNFPYNTLVGSFYVENFGCRATQADGAAIERQLADRGLSRAESSADAEVVVLNTCTVTSSADQDARASIRSEERRVG